MTAPTSARSNIPVIVAGVVIIIVVTVGAVVYVSYHNRNSTPQPVSTAQNADVEGTLTIQSCNYNAHGSCKGATILFNDTTTRESHPDLVYCNNPSYSCWQWPYVIVVPNEKTYTVSIDYAKCILFDASGYNCLSISAIVCKSGEITVRQAVGLSYFSQNLSC